MTTADGGSASLLAAGDRPGRPAQTAAPAAAPTPRRLPAFPALPTGRGRVTVARGELHPGEGRVVGSGLVIEPGGDRLGELAGLGQPDGAGVDVRQPHPDRKGEEARPHCRQGLLVARQRVPAGQPCGTDPPWPPPALGKKACGQARVGHLVLRVLVDASQLVLELQIRTREGEHFQVAGEPTLPHVDAPPDAVGVVPATGEATVLGVLPRRPGPGVRLEAHAVDVPARSVLAQQVTCVRSRQRRHRPHQVSRRPRTGGRRPGPAGRPR